MDAGMTLDQLPVVVWILGLASVVGAVGVIFKQMILPSHRTLMKAQHFLEDWHGEPARPGRKRQPGVPERLATVEQVIKEVVKEVKPNDGSSLRDAVQRTEQGVQEAKERLAAEDKSIREAVSEAVTASEEDRKWLKDWVRKHEVDHQDLPQCAWPRCGHGNDDE